jgi:V8-like Glu-specific endopeptidase
MTKLITLLCFLLAIQTMAKVSVTLNRDGSITKNSIFLNEKSMTNITKDSVKGFAGLNELLDLDKSVFGDYLRDQVLNTTVYPLSTIGMLRVGCTGTMIGPKHFITAAHCVFNYAKQRWIDLSHFSPARASADNFPYGTTRWERVHLLQDYMITGDTKYDLAVVELSKSIGNQIGWDGYGYNTNLENGKEINIVGYPGDKDLGTMWSVNCPAYFDDSLIRYRCDTYGGMSGSGIKTTNSMGEASIYGIHTSGGPYLNTGVRITKEKFTIIKHWTNGGIVDDDYTRDNPVPLQDYFKLHLKNKCHRTIWVAIHTSDLDAQWTVKGWWKLAPGEKAYVANTRNINYYFHAESDNGLKWSGDKYWYVRGKGPYGFKHKKIGLTEWGDFTQSFTCN